MNNDGSRLSVYLIYSSLIGLIGTFFSFILTPISFTTTIGTGGLVYTSSKTLVALCFDGTMPSGGFVFVTMILVLVLALIVDIIITVRLSRGDDLPKASFVLTIIYGSVTLILAIIFIASFFSTFKGQFVSIKGDTVTSGGDLWYGYLFLFEAAITAILAGIIGLKSSSYVPSYKSSNYKHVSTNQIHSVYSKFKVNDEVVLTADNSYPFVVAGTKCIVTDVTASGKIVYLKKADDKNSKSFSAWASNLKLANQVVEAEEKPIEKSTAQFSKPVKSDSDNIAKIKEYKQLLDEGIITQEEFDKKKKELLDL